MSSKPVWDNANMRKKRPCKAVLDHELQKRESHCLCCILKLK